jgi:ABC-2 type transport system ATP-binding protein
MTDAVTLSDVSKSFRDKRAVDGLSLRVPMASIYGFLGPNGAGKTTTMRMILGIFAPDEGELSVLGSQDPTEVRERLGYLPEERGLYPKMKVVDQVAYFGTLKGMSRAAAREKAARLLDEYGLGENLEQTCQSLSKGMAQKAQILATLLHEPDLIILDEPFSGLDPVNRDLMRDVILKLREDGHSVIFSTHIMEQAEQICDHVVLIDGGRKIVDGPIDEVRGHGGGAVHLDYEGDLGSLRQMEGVLHINDTGRQAEVVLAEGIDPQQVLKHLVGAEIRLHTFDLRSPSLHEIFVRNVGHSVEEASIEPQDQP